MNWKEEHGWVDKETGERASTFAELIHKRVDEKPVPWYKEFWYQVRLYLWNYFGWD